ncbi:MAG: DUF4340 domain-containing protein [Acetatifactor sp.]|nr:DUF4340 domain-containing protein [Acetatifactor sp.]
MSRQLKQLILMVIVLVVLVAVYFGVTKYQESKKDDKEENSSEVTVIDGDSDSIESFTYTYDGNTYSYEKEDDTWYYADDHSLEVTQYMIKNMLANLAPFKTENVIENVEDLSQFGLDAPSRTVKWVMNGEEYEITFGDFNTIAEVYYVYVNGDSSKVYTTESSTYTLFNKDIYALTNLEKPEEEDEEVTEAETDTETDVDAAVE